MLLPCDILGFGKFDRLAHLWISSRILDWSRAASLTRKVDLRALAEAGWPFEYRHPCEIGEGQHEKPTRPDLSWRLAFATRLLPSFESAYEDEWRRRTELNTAWVALGVERFRLATGRLPGNLDELVPQYLDSIPEDPWNPGHRFSYRIKENGDFVVYSFGYNRRDDGGKEYVRGEGLLFCDFAFTVASQKVRDDTD